MPQHDRKLQAAFCIGKLTHSLAEKLSSCNVLHLKNVKELCTQLIARHKKPPDPFECRKPFIEAAVLNTSSSADAQRG